MSTEPHAGTIELYIDKLVLHGFPRAERYRIGEAIRQELFRQLGERGIPQTLTQQADIFQLRPGPIRANHDSGPEKVGIQVAQVVYGSIAGEQFHTARDRSLQRNSSGSLNRDFQAAR